LAARFSASSTFFVASASACFTYYSAIFSLSAATFIDFLVFSIYFFTAALTF